MMLTLDRVRQVRAQRMIARCAGRVRVLDVAMIAPGSEVVVVFPVLVIVLGALVRIGRPGNRTAEQAGGLGLLPGLLRRQRVERVLEHRVGDALPGRDL